MFSLLLSSKSVLSHNILYLDIVIIMRNVLIIMAHDTWEIYLCTYTKLGRLLTKCNPLLISDYMTKIVISNVIRYITHCR